MNNNIKVLVEGKNINNYIKWLIKKKINIINLDIIDHSKAEIIINYQDYNNICKYSKTYKIKIIKKYGFLKVLEIIRKRIYIICSIIISIIFLYFLSNVIFSIDIVSNNSEIVRLISSELKKYDIEKYKFKRSYSYLTSVKNEILNNNKDKLEWLEIVEDGTKYIVKLVERKKQGEIEEYEFQSISTTKDALIKSIKALSGEKVKEINDYVKKDEIIVSGIITKPDGTEIYTKAQATVYGEVWYKITVEYPLVYREEMVTGKNKEVISINFLDKKFSLFHYKKFKEFKIITSNIIESNILPISISKDKQYEVLVKENIYTWEEAITNAVEYSKVQLLANNSKINSIIKMEILDKEITDSKVKLNLFVSVLEDITKIIEIKKDDYNLQN